jgi:hypothetical protein
MAVPGPSVLRLVAANAVQVRLNHVCLSTFLPPRDIELRLTGRLSNVAQNNYQRLNAGTF